MTTMQDVLSLGADARMNVPSTVGGNWSWRVRKEGINPEVARMLREITETYKRYRPYQPPKRPKPRKAPQASETAEVSETAAQD